MISMRRFLLFLTLGLSLSIACTKEQIEEPLLELDRSNMKMTVGQSQKLNAVLKGAEGSFVWASSKDAVATVDQDGTVTAVAAGTAQISVTVAGLAEPLVRECAVTVVDFKAAELELNEALTEVDGSYRHILAKGDAIALAPKFYSIEGEKVNDMAYARFNIVSEVPARPGETVVTVDDEGLVKAVSAGTAVVNVNGAGLSANVEFTVKSLELSFEERTMFVNEQVQVEATVLPLSLSDAEKQVKWSSSDPSVVNVTADGVIIALKATEADQPVYISATSGQIVKRCEVTVADYSIDEVRLEGLEGLKDAETGKYIIAIGGNPYDIQPKFYKDGEDVSSKVKELLVPVEYSSSNGDCAEISLGIITAKAPGKTMIKVSCGGKSAEFELEVYKYVESLKITNPEANPYRTVVGQEFKLEYTLLPEDASDKNVIFESSDNEVATVDAQGNVNVLKNGKAEIKLTAAGSRDRSVTANLLLLVADSQSERSVIITGKGVADGVLTIEKGASVQLTASCEGYDGDYTWGKKADGVVSISETGLLTANRMGEVDIYAMTDDFSLGELHVNVTGINPTAIRIDQNTGEPLEVNTADRQIQLTASSVAPENADFGGVNWYSSDEALATVNADGVVTLKKPGTVVITAKARTSDGKSELSGVTAAVTLNIASVKISSVIISAPASSVEVSYTLQMNFTVVPMEYDWKNVVWSIESGSEYASIDAGTGLLTGIHSEKQDDGTWPKAVVKVEVDGVSATKEITVYPMQPKDIQCTLPDRPLKVGEPWNLNPKCIPESLGYEVTPGFQAPVTDGVFLSYSPGRNDFMMYISDRYDNVLISFHRNFSITVEPYWVESVTLPSSKEMLTGSTTTLSPEFTSDVPGVAPTFRSVRWTTSNGDVATVDAYGRVTAKTPGEVDITATTYESWAVPAGQSQKSATCRIRITDPSVPLSVGDYFYTDGTWSTELEESKTVAGIVFAVADATSTDPKLATDFPQCTRGLVMSVNEYKSGIAMINDSAEEGWTAVYNYALNQGGYVDMANTSVYCGYSNTMAMRAYKQDKGDYSKYLDVLDAHDVAVAGASSWYLPSQYELGLIASNYDAINARLEGVGTLLEDYSAGYEGGGGTLIRRGMYWSSTYVYGQHHQSFPYMLSENSLSSAVLRHSLEYNLRFVFAF